MARIVYGVSGEGSGHTSRAGTVIPRLLQDGHQVKVAAYDRSYRDLSGRFDVLEIEGLTIAQKDNEVSIVKTITENLSRLPRGHRKSVELKGELFRKFKPHAVISDYEPMTAYLANYFEVPLITLDNQHRMRYMELDIPPRLTPGMRLAKAITQAMIPRPDVSLITTFHSGPVSNDRTYLFPPLIRQAVQEARPRRDDHIIVYFTKRFDRFIKRMAGFPREKFLVYGQGREGEVGNVRFRLFSREAFVDDLAGCKAVIASAGFTLITESLHLGKPYLALPTRGQFEQELNAFMLDRQGLGRECRQMTAETIGDFLYRMPDYDKNLSSYPRSDGAELFARLTELLADDAALAAEYRNRRS